MKDGRILNDDDDDDNDGCGGGNDDETIKEAIYFQVNNIKSICIWTEVTKKHFFQDFKDT